MLEPLFFYISYFIPAQFSSRPRCESVVVDIGFILDISEGGSYVNEKKFMKLLTKEFGISGSGTHAAVVSFSDKAALTIKLGEINDISAFNKAVDKITQNSGTARLDLALQVVKDEMFMDANGGRSQVKKLLILMTDGSQMSGLSGAKNPADVAKEIRDLGIHVLVIGIGKGIQTTELAALSGGSNWHLADSIAELTSERFIQRMSRATCDIG